VKIKIIIPNGGVKPHYFDYNISVANAMAVLPARNVIDNLPVKRKEVY
jgi:hypothetical protein